MGRYHFKENFFDASTEVIDVFDESNRPVYQMSLFYTSGTQQVMSFMGRQKHNFKIEDGKNIYTITQEGSIEGRIKTPFSTVWDVEKNGRKIGVFSTQMALKPRMVFKGVQGDAITLESGFISRSVKAKDHSGRVIMTTKSERFKIASGHDIHITDGTYNPMMLILLFQGFFEFQEHRRKKSGGGGFDFDFFD
ncbi:tubby C-terminal domain-like protein [Staphylococcus massiliensis]|uniref:Tubby C-terminal domain-containing protein n=1 Tax=Staphylococcus massiliensis S46 TaxID=1229783 RepID=K9B5A3_9STAP|nr:hypothetical protein [Staphylococcus massiliensis]EKU50002.1 hypothetical protein C273_01998 [Staphylococcus massiliensis S46]MCG3399243.1 hypothetical protein [Staphylococcus massiliensis]MCG3402288.1 hypothetical protein [Staphylococcus massiliensis]MCG3411742.1 hypothetical protein [Staphylococcus massiliensis]POA00562.1 hypothetical protein CD133_04000 [Staphylococcus massiliensis CCUG 55927]